MAWFHAEMQLSTSVWDMQRLTSAPRLARTCSYITGLAVTLVAVLWIMEQITGPKRMCVALHPDASKILARTVRRLVLAFEFIFETDSKPERLIKHISKTGTVKHIVTSLPPSLYILIWLSCQRVAHLDVRSCKLDRRHPCEPYPRIARGGRLLCNCELLSFARLQEASAAR